MSIRSAADSFLSVSILPVFLPDSNLRYVALLNTGYGSKFCLGQTTMLTPDTQTGFFILQQLVSHLCRNKLILAGGQLIQSIVRRPDIFRVFGQRQQPTVQINEHNRMGRPTVFFNDLYLV